ncbi:MAG: menaquinone biosynthesis protein [Chthoniobacterales bacterium]|nr:menaquinone biosynthesis protein [Chthoniobacterales bacterium]
MTPGAAQPLRVGCVKYLNAQPLIFGWTSPVVFAHPAALCQDLADGKLDVAFVSSFEFLRNPIYSVVDTVAVASAGPVHSVFLAHTAPLEEMQEIVLDPASRTSVNLLRCLLAERGLRPRLVPKSGATGEAGGERAELMIGDQALAFRAAHAYDQRFWDLATAWQELTALPFVFALWLIRPEVANAGEIAASLRRLRDTNLQRLDRVIAAQTGFTPEFCAFYFRDCLRFSFADAERAGLLRFRDLCKKHGILPPQETPLRLV